MVAQLSVDDGNVQHHYSPNRHLRFFDGRTKAYGTWSLYTYMMFSFAVFTLMI
jgi:hypothetical protein